MTAASEKNEDSVGFEPPPHLLLDAAVERVLQRVRLRAKCRIAWLQFLWRDEGHSGTRQLIDQGEIAAILDDRDAPCFEAQWLAANDAMAPAYGELTSLEKAIKSDQSSRLALLGKVFSLSTADHDILQTALALAVDPSLSRLYAYLQDHPNRGYVSEELVKRLFGYGRRSLLPSDSPLRLWRLVQETSIAPGEPPMLSIDRTVKDWLLGDNTLDPALVGHASFKRPVEPLGEWPVDHCSRIASQHLAEGQAVRFIVSGVPGSGRRSLAATIAAQLGMTLLTIDSEGLDADDWSGFFLYSQRQAFLAGQALCWSGTGISARRWPGHLLMFPLQFVIVEPDQALPECSGVTDHRVEMPAASIEERRQLWQRLVPAAAAWHKADFEQLVTQHQSTVGEITAVAARRIETLPEAERYLRELSRHRLGELAQSVTCPYTWEDLVLPQRVSELLQDFTFEARDRVAFWEDAGTQRLFPQGRGHMALFSGPSGTGKTMSAQVIAAALGLELFRIDLSAVVSKYVGETSKNLQSILTRAQGMDVVLLFDEADALLGKRTDIGDAHDRFANTDTNYLLQALEDYQGLAILSTNRKGNIDEAFLRRFRYVIEFPKPDVQQRRELWHSLVEQMIGQFGQAEKAEKAEAGEAGEAGEIAEAGKKAETGKKAGTTKKAEKDKLDEDSRALAELKSNIDRLASGIELTGAQIKFSLLAAIFNARRHQQFPGIRHLLHGIDRELMKDGRVLSDRERQRLGAHEPG